MAGGAGTKPQVCGLLSLLAQCHKEALKEKSGLRAMRGQEHGRYLSSLNSVWLGLSNEKNSNDLSYILASFSRALPWATLFGRGQMTR